MCVHVTVKWVESPGQESAAWETACKTKGQVTEQLRQTAYYVLAQQEEIIVRQAKEATILLECVMVGRLATPVITPEP